MYNYINNFAFYFNMFHSIQPCLIGYISCLMVRLSVHVMSLWHCDVIWRHRTVSTLVQIMCLVGWWHQIISWTNADLSLMVFCGAHMGAISQQLLMNCNLRLHFWNHYHIPVKQSFHEDLSFTQIQDWFKSVSFTQIQDRLKSVTWNSLLKH